MNKALAALPATRWDRLMAVLEENEPERAIDAARILEHANRLEICDLHLFHLLLMRYQDKNSETLRDVVSLYAAMSAWMDWIVEVQRCLDVKKGRLEIRRTTSASATSSLPSCNDTTDCSENCVSSCGFQPSLSSFPDGHVKSSFPCGQSSGFPSDGASRQRSVRPSSGSRAAHPKTTRQNIPAQHRHRFDLGANWKWDGSLDFLRNGRVLCCLVEEALDHGGMFEALQDDHRLPIATLDTGTYEMLYPSLRDIESGGRATGQVARTPTGAGVAAEFDPAEYLMKFNSSRLSNSRRGQMKVSKALQIIERQGKNLAAAEQWVRKLNNMCEHFLGWKKAEQNGQSFFDLCNSDNLLLPLNSDDARLLHRMHWLAVSLYRTVNDPTIIPAPTRMSFIMIHDSLENLPDTSREDEEISLQVATKCSCLPQRMRLDVVLAGTCSIKLSHPDMEHGTRSLPCTIVKDEVFAYLLEFQAFLPVWRVLQNYLKRFDRLSWRFEMNRNEREQLAQVLGLQLPGITADPSAGETTGLGGSGTFFDLTVRDSTAGCGFVDQLPEICSAHRLTTSLMETNSTRPLKFDHRLPFNEPLRRPMRRETLHRESDRGGDVDTAVVKHGRFKAENTGCRNSFFAATAPVPASDAVLKEVTIHSAASDAVATATCTVGEVNIASGDPAMTRVGTTPSLRPPSRAPVTSVAPGQTALKSSPAAKPEKGGPRGPLTKVMSHSPPAMTSEEEAHLGRNDDTAIGRTHFASAVEPDERLVVSPYTLSRYSNTRTTVSCVSHLNCDADYNECEEAELTSEVSATVRSESSTIRRNFVASIVLESGQSGIAIYSHHFRVCGGPIGKGAFGAVYKALNLDTGLIVAVKQSRYSYDSGSTDLNWRELQTWSMLPPHPNVIIFYGASKEVDTHQLLLVMEYASGGSIVQLYRQFRPIPEPLFYNHACGIARGLKHLHDHNVIHGDVKPENVLTRSDGSVAISDFGCSRFFLVGTDGTSSHLRYTRKENSCGSLVGTAAYMAPEVILNKPHLKSDVWAYACTLLQLWLGQTPWSDCTRHFSVFESIPLMYYIAEEEVVPYTTSQIEKAPRWLQRITQHALERDVEHRCTIGEIISILTEYSRAYCA